jgi:3alpha(or 20beta)-hydroxysteroid dehydrogenase
MGSSNRAGRCEGKVVLVTGAARGTGEQTARILVDEGAKVVIADVQDELGKQVAEDLGESAIYVHMDVSSEESWTEGIAASVSQFGQLNGLVNNAGIFVMEALEDTGLSDFERLIKVNQIGPFLGMRAVVPTMKEAGGGSIVNISSVDGLSAKNGLVAYAATKWALRGMTRVAAIELGKYGIRVNAVCPEAGGPEMRAPYVPEGIDPAITLAFTHKLLSYQQSREPIELVRDIAKMVVFLVSDETLSCTGADYPVDAGWTAGKHLKFNPGA